MEKNEELKSHLLLKVTVDSDKNLKVVSTIKDRKTFINLLIDILKLANNKEESRIITP